MNISVNTLKQNNIKYDWITLYVGLKLDIIIHSDITQYAIDFLKKHPHTDNQNIIHLAWGEADMDYESLLEDVLKDFHTTNLNAEVRQFEKRKWRFGTLVYLKMKYQDDLEELLNKVAEVYADFNYPEDMDSFINYLEPNDGFNPSKYSKEENLMRLINLFNKFIYKERHDLQNNNR